MTSEKDFIKNIKISCKRFKKDGAKLKIASAILSADNDEGTNPIFSVIITNELRHQYNEKAIELAKSVNFPYEGIVEELGTLVAAQTMFTDITHESCEKITNKLSTICDSPSEVSKQLKNFRYALEKFTLQILTEAYGS